MFLYGNMLRVKDRLMVNGHWAVVREIWPSKYYKGRWADMWIEDGDVVPRHAAIFLVEDFRPLFDVQRPGSTDCALLLGVAATPYCASQE